MVFSKKISIKRELKGERWLHGAQHGLGDFFYSKKISIKRELKVFVGDGGVFDGVDLLPLRRSQLKEN